MPSENTRDQISDLILRVALRDRIAFDRLYAATSAKLFGTCLGVLKDRAEAEEWCRTYSSGSGLRRIGLR